MAARAASFTSAGAGKSGKPCAKLTAPCCRARRVISRITDSVKYSAFSESIRRAVAAILSAVGFASAELVIVVLGKTKGFTDERHRAKRVKRSQTQCWKHWPPWQGRADRSGGKARRCGPQSGRIHESA